MNRKTVGLGVFSILFGIFILILSRGIRDFAAVGVGAKFFPRIAGLGFIVLGSIFLFGQIQLSLQQRGQANTDSKSVFTWTINPAVFSMILLVLYVAAISTLGYIISSVIYIYLQIIILNRGKKIHHIRYAVTAVISSLASYFLFVRIFGVMIPAGLLG